MEGTAFDSQDRKPKAGKAVEHPLLVAISKAQYDLTSAQAWLAEVKRQVAALELVAPELPSCEICGTLRLPATVTMAEHMENVHGILPQPDYSLGIWNPR